MTTPRFAAKMLTDLSLVGAFDEAERTTLVESLNSLAVEVYPFEHITEAVRGIRQDMKSEDRTRLVNALSTYLYTVASSLQAPSELLQITAERFNSTAVEPEIAKRTCEFLARLLVDGNLLISFKATSLFEDSEHLVLDSKLLVDLRPVFSLHRPTEVAASIVLYKLRLRYRDTTSSEAANMTFTLRNEELKELSSTLARAALKTKALGGVSGLGTVLETKQ